MIAKLLDKVAAWALSKYPAGPYRGSEDPRRAFVIETDGNPYMTRIVLPKVFGIVPMLNRFHRHDIDRALHNHPWGWAVSIVLSGSYEETRLCPDADDSLAVLRGVGDHEAQLEDFTFARTVKWFNVLRDTDYHKVDKLRGDVWTLFITGPKSQDWGFLVNSVHVPWRKYFGKKR